MAKMFLCFIFHIEDQFFAWTLFLNNFDTWRDFPKKVKQFLNNFRG